MLYVVSSVHVADLSFTNQNFFTASSERSCEIFPMWFRSGVFLTVFLWEASFGRGSEILFQTILNSSLILPSCVATLNVVSHYRKPDLRDWPFKVDLSHPPSPGVCRVWCRWQRPSCRSSAGLSSVSDVLNESFAVKYPPSMSRRHERWRSRKKRGSNSLVWPHLLMCSRPFRRLCLTRVAQHRALHFGWPAAVQEGVVKRW